MRGAGYRARHLTKSPMEGGATTPRNNQLHRNVPPLTVELNRLGGWNAGQAESAGKEFGFFLSVDLPTTGCWQIATHGQELGC